MANQSYRLLIERVREASQKVDPVFRDTPQFICDSLSELLDMTLVVKIEILNPVRCFKARGTEVLADRIAPGTSLFCASAGNFGQALAWSCRKRNLDLTVYAAVTANPYKVERMKSLGAKVILYGNDFDEAKLEGKRQAKAQDVRFVEDSLDIETLEGAATIGLELLQFPRPVETVLVALGNGAMLNGIGRIIKYQRPETKCIAVQASGAPAMVESWRSGKIITNDRANTIADGIAVRIPVPQALKDMEGLVDDAVLVTEESIISAMQLIHEHLGLVSEPSGAVGLAAILERPDRFRNQTVATIICGGNVTNEQRKTWLM